jgi:predicted Zn-dependent protease
MFAIRFLTGHIRLFVAGAVFAAFVSFATGAAAQRVSLIRDAEIENTIRVYATPLFNAAGLDPQVVEIHLVADRRLNAFVTLGQHLFLNTGLLMRADDAGEVIGVIAHETGHIEGGHLVQGQRAMQGAAMQSILTAVLGAAAAVITGIPALGTAVLSGGSELTRRNFLKYTRTQEESADQAALTLLDETHQSSKGLMRFLDRMSSQELLTPSQQDPYLRTHPITRNRITHIRNHIAQSKWSDVPIPEDLQALHRRMRAKLYAYMEPPMQAFLRYKEDNVSLEARYARAIAYHRLGRLEDAIAEMDSLIGEFPDDPYFHELKGQILFESGRIQPSIASYREAVRLLPDAPLIRIGLAQALLETNDIAHNAEALDNLMQAVQTNEKGPDTWRLLAIAYGRKGDFGLTALALAEEALAMGKHREARGQAKRAQKKLAIGSPGWLRAQDIEREAEEQKKKEE